MSDFLKLFLTVKNMGSDSLALFFLTTPFFLKLPQRLKYYIIAYEKYVQNLLPDDNCMYCDSSNACPEQGIDIDRYTGFLFFGWRCAT